MNDHRSDSDSPGPSGPDPADVTMLIQAVSAGREGSQDELLAAVYQELRTLAASRMRREKPGQTLQATALVHEAWLRLLGPDGEQGDWGDRRYFFGAAARAMRQILVERHRRVHRLRHGGELQRVDELDANDVEITVGPDVVDLMALNDALTELEQHDPRMAEIVQLRYFGGLSVEDTAAAMDLSPRTVKREWSVARGWLKQRMD